MAEGKVVARGLPPRRKGYLRYQKGTTLYEAKMKRGGTRGARRVCSPKKPTRKRAAPKRRAKRSAKRSSRRGKR